MSDLLVVDYGMGNILSVLSAVRYLGATVDVTSDPEAIAIAPKLILPGVGSFRRAMESLRASGLDQAIHRAVRGESKLLGICLGMQLLGTVGTEDGETEGLGLIDQRVDSFAPGELAGRKIPHIGFSAVKGAPESKLFAGLPAEADFYFVHSYRMLPDIPDTIVSPCAHGVPFAAAVEKDNVFGTQFHPEKSQTNGLLLLKNFLSL
jgi:glutamine amidotransferase